MVPPAEIPPNVELGNRSIIFKYVCVVALAESLLDTIKQGHAQCMSMLLSVCRTPALL